MTRENAKNKYPIILYSRRILPQRNLIRFSRHSKSIRLSNGHQIFINESSKIFINDSVYDFQEKLAFRHHHANACFISSFLCGARLCGKSMSKLMIRLPFCVGSFDRGMPSDGTILRYPGLKQGK